jgi:hypothetical protein
MGSAGGGVRRDRGAPAGIAVASSSFSSSKSPARRIGAAAPERALDHPKIPGIIQPSCKVPPMSGTRHDIPHSSRSGHHPTFLALGTMGSNSYLVHEHLAFSAYVREARQADGGMHRDGRSKALPTSQDNGCRTVEPVRHLPVAACTLAEAPSIVLPSGTLPDRLTALSHPTCDR